MREAAGADSENNIHERLLNEVLKRSAKAILLLNPQAQISFASPHIKEISGYPAGELKGKNAVEFLRLKDPDAANRQSCLKALTENEALSLIQIRRQAGDWVWVDVTVTNLLDDPVINAILVVLQQPRDPVTHEHQLAQAVVEAREQERAYLASELHDNINQIITATRLLIEAAGRQDNRADLLRLSAANLRLVTDEIRKLSYSMTTYDLQDQGLAFALQAFLTTISAASPVTFCTAMDENAMGRLSAEQQLHVYRIIQEGIQNILRHAGASHAEIRLSARQQMIHLVISDNGTGFPCHRPKPGIGLSGIANRVKLLQGHFHIRAPQGSGTTLQIDFPL